ncbi:MAG TPA: secretin N-terminal domain-containing protein [Pyrinomonadaceae bacterium]
MNYKASASAARAWIALVVVCCLLCAPITALARKGEKNYSRGVDFERMQQWERAAQEFALAVAANPSDIEYQLHYRRAVFNASQRFMEQGRSLAEQGDYAGAYNAFRMAYGYDPINELAASEMERMLRLQHEKEGRNTSAPNGNNRTGAGTATGTVSRANADAPTAGGVAALPAAYRVGNGPTAVQQPALGRSEQLRVINYSGDLEQFIRQLANELNLNVIFDRDFPKRTINLQLRDVTTARALDHIFLAQGLFFQKLDRRTILVADQSKRPQYQQLVLRTFFLSNTDPNEARSLIQSALPPNSGRTPQVVPNKQTNSITVRDTPENIRLIAQLLQSVDKDRAEVVMDVNIYEVSRTNLLQVGNQIGSESTLGNLGGLLPGVLTFSKGAQLLGGTTGTTTGTGKGGGTGTTTGGSLLNVIGGSFLLPPTSISLFQSKDNTRLLASTQVHAFDGEQSTTNIGQKVPVQTAAVTPFNGTGVGATNGSPATAGLFGGGYPVIQYQDTGLNLKFTPTVFPNQEVQVKMEIEANDVVGGASNLTPTFSQRRLSGTARIPNNRTMMIASVMQDKHADGRRGLPLVGLVPILGRLFTTPTKSDTNSDIVVTVTPRVLRAPTVTPEDLEMRESGTLQSPTSQSLEAMLVEADRDDLLAAARSLPTNANVELSANATQLLPVVPATSDPEPPSFVPAPAVLTASAGVPASNDANNAATASAPQTINASMTSATVNTTPVSLVGDNKTGHALAPMAPALLLNSAHHLVLPEPATHTNAPAQPAPVNQTQPAPVAINAAAPAASMPASGAALMLISNQPEMRVGERQRLMILIKTGAPLNLAATTLRFDPRFFAVRSVTKGNLLDGAAGAQATLTQSIDPTGSLLAVVAPATGTSLIGMGVLLLVEIEAIAPGEGNITFEPAGVHFMGADGRGITPQLAQAHLIVRQ